MTVDKDITREFFPRLYQDVDICGEEMEDLIEDFIDTIDNDRVEMFLSQLGEMLDEYLSEDEFRDEMFRRGAYAIPRQRVREVVAEYLLNRLSR